MESCALSLFKLKINSQCNKRNLIQIITIETIWFIYFFNASIRLVYDTR